LRRRRTPVFHAVAAHHSKCVDLLAEFGANIDVKCGPYNHTPLMLAISKGYNEIIAILLQRGAKPDFVDGDVRRNFPLVQ
jgi:ankyrin repeat protein